MATQWESILDGSLADKAASAIDGIGQALPAPGTAPDHVGAGGNPTLASGDAGMAIFWAYRHFADGDPDHAQRAVAYLDSAMEGVTRSPLPEGLFSGFSGVAWVAEHLSERLLGEGEDMNDAVDEALLAGLQSPHLRAYDLVLGLVGLGVYAQQRIRYETGRRCLQFVLSRILDTAERGEGHATWFTPPALSSSHQRTYAPQGHYNLGLAHGVPGVIALLGTVLHAGEEEQPGLRRLLDEAVSWLFTCALPEAHQTVLPNYVAHGLPGTDGRSAWCYGDPGVAAALLIAARATGNDTWECEAVRWMKKCAARPMHDAGVQDAGLCHGAAGLAHIFNRVYQATGIDQFADASRRWYRRTFELQRNDAGVAGFPAYARDSALTPVRWDSHPGLLTGATGVGLSLLAASTAVEPSWDRCLLVDLPLRA